MANHKDPKLYTDNENVNYLAYQLEGKCGCEESTYLRDLLARIKLVCTTSDDINVLSKILALCEKADKQKAITMPKIDLSKMRSNAMGKEFSQALKDDWTRQAATEIDTSDNYGCKHYYSTCGNYLVFAYRDQSGYTHVYETRIERSTVFNPSGEQID